MVSTTGCSTTGSSTTGSSTTGSSTTVTTGSSIGIETTFEKPNSEPIISNSSVPNGTLILNALLSEEV